MQGPGIPYKIPPKKKKTLQTEIGEDVLVVSGPGEDSVGLTLLRQDFCKSKSLVPAPLLFLGQSHLV
jgi:hypothetical protein